MLDKEIKRIKKKGNTQHDKYDSLQKKSVFMYVGRQN
jgi:hypothetical protein